MLYLFNMCELYNNFRKYNFIGNELDKYVIEAIFNALYTNEYVDVQDIENTKQKILYYMVSRNEKDYSQYLKYLLGSKLLKTHPINIARITEETKIKIEKIKDSINELEELKCQNLQQDVIHLKTI